MTEIAPTTIVKGKSYILWVKDADGNSDTIYAVVHKGNSRFAFLDFEYVCKTTNKFLFYTNKVNDGKDDCTWADCLYEMKVKKPPVGNPFYMTDRAYTFAEVAAWGCKNNLFPHPDGIAHLVKSTSPPSTSVPVKVPRVGGPAVVNQALDNPGIIAAAKEMSDKMDQSKAANPVSAPSLIPCDILKDVVVDAQGNVVETARDPADTVPVDPKEVIEIDGDDAPLGEDMENMKQRVAVAESAAEDLKMRNVELVNQVDVLNAKLESSLAMQKQFMAASDKTGATLEKLNDDAADKVTKSLASKLSLLTSLDTNLGSVLNKVGLLGSSIADIPKLVGEHVAPLLTSVSDVLATKIDKIESCIDTSQESIKSGIMATNETLCHFGFADDENAVNIPASIQSLLDDANSTKIRKELVNQDCYYLSRQMIATFVCKCECGLEVQLDQTAFDNGPVGDGSALSGAVYWQGVISGQEMSRQDQGAAHSATAAHQTMVQPHELNKAQLQPYQQTQYAGYGQQQHQMHQSSQQGYQPSLNGPQQVKQPSSQKQLSQHGQQMLQSPQQGYQPPQQQVNMRQKQGVGSSAALGQYVSTAEMHPVSSSGLGSALYPFHNHQQATPPFSAQPPVNPLPQKPTRKQRKQTKADEYQAAKRLKFDNDNTGANLQPSGSQGPRMSGPRVSGPLAPQVINRPRYQSNALPNRGPGFFQTPHLNTQVWLPPTNRFSKPS